MLSVLGALLSSIPTCTTTPWPADKPLSRSTDNLRFSSTTSILMTTPAKVSSRYSHASGEHANQLRKQQRSLPERTQAIGIRSPQQSITERRVKTKKLHLQRRTR